MKWVKQIKKIKSDFGKILTKIMREILFCFEKDKKACCILHKNMKALLDKQTDFGHSIDEAGKFVLG